MANKFFGTHWAVQADQDCSSNMGENAKRAVTVIEILVVLVCLSLAGMIILPVFSNGREQERRERCAMNLSRLGQGMQIYAQQDPGLYPIATGVDPTNTGVMRIFSPLDRMTPPGSPITDSVPSPTSDMWLLIRSNLATPKQFICPSTSDTPDPAQNTNAYYDFLTAAHLSYGYQYQHDLDRPQIGRQSEPVFPVMADANPYIKGGVTADALTYRASGARGNSTNHAYSEGQNILFQAGYVIFERGPDVGLSGKIGGLKVSRGRDNCYSTILSATGAVDPGSNQPYNTICNLGNKSDACLVP